MFALALRGSRARSGPERPAPRRVAGARRRAALNASPRAAQQPHPRRPCKASTPRPRGRGAEEGGLLGLLGGAARALLGLAIRPVAWLLATSAAVADSVRTTVTGAPASLPRLRPPRPVPAGAPLPPYDWSEVRACRSLHRAPGRGCQARETDCPFCGFHDSCQPP